MNRSALPFVRGVYGRRNSNPAPRPCWGGVGSRPVMVDPDWMLKEPWTANNRGPRAAEGRRGP